MPALEIDYTVEKLERNHQHGYKHIDTQGKHWSALLTGDVCQALDVAIARDGINDPSIFLTLLYHITAHQTYHAPIDEKSTLTYHGIEQMLEKGEGNPRIHKLENLLNAHGVSLAICRVQDREDDVPHAELQRACFFQDEVTKERWQLRETIAMLFEFGLQYRIFLLEDVEKLNILTHSMKIEVSKNTDRQAQYALNKSMASLMLLLTLFNVTPSMYAALDPPTRT